MDDCLQQLLNNTTAFLETECPKILVSKAIGYAVIAGSALVKLPQILKIHRAGSVAGISHASVLFEFVATLVNVSYFLPLGYPFSTWGENAFLLAQNSALYILHAHMSGGLRASFLLEALPSERPPRRERHAPPPLSPHRRLRVGARRCRAGERRVCIRLRPLPAARA